MGGQRQEWEKMVCLQTQSELLGSRTNDYLVPQLGSCLGNSTERGEARGGGDQIRGWCVWMHR